MTDSTNQTDVAVLAQEAFLPWKAVKPLFENQIEFNYLEEALLNSRAKVSDGKIRIMNQAYSIIVVEDGYKFEKQTWKTLQSFVQQGGTVLQLDKGDQAKPVEIGQKKITFEEELPSIIMQSLNLKPRRSPACKDLRMSHIIKENVHFYVWVNEGEEDLKGNLFSEVKGKTEIWSPWTGETKAAVTCESEDGLEITFTVHRRESLLIVIDPSQENVSVPTSKRRLIKTEDLSHSWRLETLPENQLNREIDHLSPWNQWEDMTYFSGTLSYVKEFDVENLENFFNIEIDLGEVHEMARVWINDVEIGVKMWAPYTFTIKEYLEPRLNQLKIEVTNSLANHYDQVSLPSGLVGPVTLNYFIKE